MLTIIFIQLLNEGTIVYRPVPALKRDDNTFEVMGYDLYDPQDETWEFLPGSIVLCDNLVLEGKDELVAKRFANK